MNPDVTGDLEAREEAARAALGRISLYLEKPAWGGYVITDKPGDLTETVIIYPALEMVEEFVATHPRLAGGGIISNDPGEYGDGVPLILNGGCRS